MMKMSHSIPNFLVVFLLSCLAFSRVNSTPVTCSSSGMNLECTIETNNSTLIQETIASYFFEGGTTLKIIVEEAGVGATLNISLPDNITKLTVQNLAGDAIFVETYTINSGVESIDFKTRKIEIKQRNFFTFFPNLKVFFANYIRSRYIPFFTQNKNLTKVVVEISTITDVPSRVITSTIFGGLDKLEHLVWRYGEITGIKPGAFKGVNKLTRLTLSINSIEKLESCTFEGLENLDSLYLSYNSITSVHPNAFLGLNNLQILHVDYNPSISLPAITVLKSLRTLDLSGINSINILPEIIQQLTNLTNIYFEYIDFNCTCDTEWIRKLSSFEIATGSYGSSCIVSSLPVTDATLYTNCEAHSNQCFNKSIECVGENWNRVDTGNGCECIYPEASYTASEICNDSNECEDSTICQGNCTNTPGSYKCSCLEGFYNMNDTICSDIDECIVGNGNCSHNCSNSLGSFECFCLTGFEKQGFSDCVDINECLQSNGNCSQNCSNIRGSFECFCLTGFEKQGFSNCVDINECLQSNGNCFHNCSNTVGSYECTCLPGYMKHGSTECSPPDACTINNGGCHHNCTDTIDGYVCSCFEGFKESPLNSSHCDKDFNAGTDQQNAISKEPAFYILLFLCFLFLTSTILLFLFLIFIFLYFRRQIQLFNPTQAPIVLSLAELDNKKQKQSTVFKSPNSPESVPVN